MYNNEIEKILKQPYIIDGIITPIGDWQKIKGLKPILYKKIINLLSIRQGTYLDHPELGNRIADFIGEDLTNSTATAIGDHIKEIITKFIPDVIVTDVNHQINFTRKTIYMTVYLLIISTNQEFSIGMSINMNIGVVAQFELLN